MFTKVTTDEKDVLIHLYNTHYFTAFKDVDHRIIDLLETAKIMKGPKRDMLTFKDNGEDIMFLNVMAPEWWEDDMWPVMHQVVQRYRTMKYAFKKDSEFSDYVLDKNKILHMKDRLKWEQDLINEYL